MKVKNEERRRKVESTKGVIRGINTIIGRITKARDEAQKLIEKAENTADDELFAEMLEEAREMVICEMSKVALAHTLALAMTEAATSGEMDFKVTL
nr:MAG TPA: hypothetical protein [Caudoviricetes sp.]